MLRTSRKRELKKYFWLYFQNGFIFCGDLPMIEFRLKRIDNVNGIITFSFLQDSHVSNSCLFNALIY